MGKIVGKFTRKFEKGLKKDAGGNYFGHSTHSTNHKVCNFITVNGIASGFVSLKGYRAPTVQRTCMGARTGQGALKASVLCGWLWQW